MKPGRVLALPEPPRTLGPLLTAKEVAALIGGVTPDWVRKRVPGKRDLGHRTKRWYERDVLGWIDSTGQKEDEG